MSQLPLTMLGRSVALQPEMNASPAQMVLGGEPVLPGVIVPDTPENNQESHELLKTLQQNASKPAVPMSIHRPIDEEYLPKDFKSATHVYVKFDNPENLGQKYVGPYVIISRPSNTQVTIRVGYTKDGLPRLQTHHWNNCRVAHLRPDAQEGVRPKPGRPRTLPVKSNMAARFEKETLSEPVTQPNNLPPSSATMEQLQITQPRTSGDRFELANAADAADFGSLPAPSPSHHDSLSYSTRVTGPPRQQPFPDQNQNNPRQEPGDFNDPAVSGEQASSQQKGPGSVPPGKRDNPTGPQPVTKPTTGQQPVSTRPHISRDALQDHDYIRCPTATLDHDYYQPMPEVNPPPGFNHGRPNRNRQMPNRFNDFQLYAVNCY